MKQVGWATLLQWHFFNEEGGQIKRLMPTLHGSRNPIFPENRISFPTRWVSTSFLPTLRSLTVKPPQPPSPSHRQI